MVQCVKTEQNEGEWHLNIILTAFTASYLAFGVGLDVYLLALGAKFSMRQF